MPRKWWTLAGACAGLFLLMLDSTVVALALPVIHREVGASSESLQWILNIYLLTVAIFVISAGRLGDMFGRKRAFLVGMLIFAAGSVFSAFAQSSEMLVAGRVIQGLGAAPILTLSLAIICTVFPDKGEQARALGIWAAVSAIALAIGPLAGGALVEVDWRAIFWVNVPIALGGAAVMLWAAPESTDPASGTRIDWAGLALLCSGLFAVVLALIEADAWGPGPALAVGLAGVLLLAVFTLVEHRVADPLVQFSLFRNGPYFGATAAAFALVGAYWSVMFFQPQYLQDARGHSAVESGLMILPITVPMILISPFSGPLIGRFGARALMTTGMLLGTAGLVVLTQIDATTPYGVLLAGYLLFGIALGFVYAPMSTAAMAAMPPQKVGIAAGVLAMNRLVAGAVALAVCGAVFHSLLGGGHGFADAVAVSTWVIVVLCAVGAVLTWAFVRDPAQPGPDPAVAGEPPPEQLHHHLHHRRFHL
jgi:EmrB/QacA subfamily drug resistance transporter